MTVVPLFEVSTGQPCVGLHLVVVGEDLRSDGGLADHCCLLASPRQWAGRLVQQLHPSLALAGVFGRFSAITLALCRSSRAFDLLF